MALVGLFADERCSAAILEYLQTTGVGTKPPRREADSPVSNEASEGGGNTWVGG